MLYVYALLYWLLSVGCCLLVAVYWLLFIGCCLFVAVLFVAVLLVAVYSIIYQVLNLCMCLNISWIYIYNTYNCMIYS